MGSQEAAQATEFDIGKGDMPARPRQNDKFLWWSLGSNPLWLNFSEPTLLNLTLPGTLTPRKNWNPDFVVIDGNYTADSWVYMVLTAPDREGVPFQKKSYFPVLHPVSVPLYSSTSTYCLQSTPDASSWS
jgi:hypothetical protein